MTAANKGAAGINTYAMKLKDGAVIASNQRSYTRTMPNSVGITIPNEVPAIPTVVDTEKIKAEYRDGVVRVNLPKREEAKPKQISISVTK